MTNPDNRRSIIVHETPEMANWMHPQTEERKELIRKRMEEAKKHFSQINRNPVLRDAAIEAARKGIYPTVEFRVGSSLVVVTRMSEHIPLKKAALQPKMQKKFRRVPLTAQHKTN